MCLPGASSGENKHTGRATTAGRAAPGTSPLTPSPERIRSHCRALAAIRLRAVPSLSLRASALCVASRVSRAPVAGVGTVTCLRHPAASRTRAGADAWPLGDRCGFPGRRPISEECGPVAEELSNGGPLENAGFDIAGLPQAEGTSVRGYATRAKHEGERHRRAASAARALRLNAATRCILPISRDEARVYAPDCIPGLMASTCFCSGEHGWRLNVSDPRPCGVRELGAVAAARCCRPVRVPACSSAVVRRFAAAECMAGGPMSLSAHDRQVLDFITESLTVSDPVLAGLLDTFTRLTAGELMPAREQIGARSRQMRGTARRPGRRLGPAGIMILVWLLLTALFVSMAVVLSNGSPAPCRTSWAMGCADPAPSAAAHAGPS